MNSHSIRCCACWTFPDQAITTGTNRREIRRRAAQRNERDAIIRRCFLEQKSRYGAPRLAVELREQGYHWNVKTIANSLKRQQLRAIAGKKFRPRTTDSDHQLPVYENVLKQDFSATAPNQKWVQDITYIRTTEGWLYLAVVIDLYSRLVVGWAMSRRMHSSLVCDALYGALARRGHPEGVTVHSDRGSQYCSKNYRQLLKKYHLVGSMSAKGCCYDNACAESFFHQPQSRATLR